MNGGPEFLEVEQPFIDQLIDMGWKFTTGNSDDPTATGRESFRDVILREDLRRALVRINLDDDGNSWLDDARVSQAISALERHGEHRLIEANQAATEVLLAGTPVDGLPDQDGGRAKTVRFVDWDHPENNTFRVVNQLRVDEPGGQAKKFILPDLVLFVNGIPLVAIECKSPYIAAPMEEAIDQLQRYANQRVWVDGNEGNEKLFHTNQFVVATCFEETRVGTITSLAEHYLEWKDTSPVSMGEVAATRRKASLSSQEKLIAGMLRPAHLLDIVRHFTLFGESGGRTIKIVPRYQQFRAVHSAVERLLAGDTRAADGEHDRRGGIIWHTQGSGKSLTMVFLVRKLHSDPSLRRFKVVVVTDRKSLEDQLSKTAELSGETVKIARSTEKLKELLAQKGPGLVFAMIQKYQDRDTADDDVEEDEDDGGIRDQAGEVGEFPVLNEDESVLVLVDEAHRSHASALHGNLLRALPNCARIGFTGTPIIMGAKKRTHEIFGEFIDRYTIRESEEDGATVPILYEGRTSSGAVADGRDLDQVFEDMLQERTKAELEAIKRKYATKGQVLEAEKLIEAKARDMLRHYVENILPNGFKAQIVTVSRRATLRYHKAFLAARDELVGEIEALDPALLGKSEEEIQALDRRMQFLVRARSCLETLREIEFAPVISGGNNDDPSWREWTKPARVRSRTQRFKKPLAGDDPEKCDPLSFIIVKSMLLTGFDAPVEGVMYLDRYIKEAELLQAIARVNRNYDRKSAGIVVDYYGVARHLQEALAAYSSEDVEGVLHSLKDEIPKLRDRHRRVLQVLVDHGAPDLADEAACIEAVADEKVRAEFHVKLKQFLTTLELVLPRPEGLPYVADAKRLGLVQLRARNRYRDGVRPIGKEVGEKVRRLIDEHVISLGIDPSIPPISILDADFADHVSREQSDRAKASEMEHALRYHIRRHLDEDPEHYEKLSERLDHILEDLKGQWTELVEALKDLVGDIERGRKQDETGLDPETQAPFLGSLRQETAGKGKLPAEQLRKLADVTVEMVAHIRQEIRLVGFWGNAHAQQTLRHWLVQFLDDHEVLPFERLSEVADRIVELAKVNHERLTR